MKSLVSNFWGLEWVLSESGHEFTEPLLLPITPQTSAEAHNLVNVNFSYSIMPNISFGKMSLERPRGRQKELKGPGTKWSLGWMHPWMFFFALYSNPLGKLRMPRRTSSALACSQGRWNGAAHVPWLCMELELTSAELKRLCLIPHIASEVVSFVFKVVHHSCHVWSDPATTTQQAQNMAPPGLAVMLLKAFFPHRNMEIQIQDFSAK